MQLLTGEKIREWDQYTMVHEPVSSIELMERAALSFVNWFLTSTYNSSMKVTILCGNGNNGGDGLVIARHLRNQFADVAVWILRQSPNDSPDFDVNLSRLLALGDVPVTFIHDSIPVFDANSVCIDAFLGTGVTRALEGIPAQLVEAVNRTGFIKMISVDMPSGLPADTIVQGNAVQADVIFTFQLPKRSFFLLENADYCREWIVGEIGLHQGFLHGQSCEIQLTERKDCHAWLRGRFPFSHKGNFGHVMMFAGSAGKTGAAILASHAAIRSGCGWVTAILPEETMGAIHAVVPEVMCLPRSAIKTHFEDRRSKGNTGETSSVRRIWACGPGLGTDEETVSALHSVLKTSPGSMVIDADALNIIAANPAWLRLIPEGSVLTPHPGEFFRLFGKSGNSLETRKLLIEKAIELGVILILKGRFTQVACPDGTLWINPTGNAGMASAGSGDVLTGVIASLLAQGYPSWQAAVLGVYLHGLAGDLACAGQAEESLIASDIIHSLGNAFQTVRKFSV